jgi:hypothetical protein
MVEPVARKLKKGDKFISRDGILNEWVEDIPSQMSFAIVHKIVEPNVDKYYLFSDNPENVNTCKGDVRRLKSCVPTREYPYMVHGGSVYKYCWSVYDVGPDLG